MPVNIVIAVKDSRQGKSRLAPMFSIDERADFARYLYRRTLFFFTTQFPEQHLSVVTPSHDMAVLAEQHGAAVIREPRQAGLSTAAAFAARWSTWHGFDTQLLVPADIAVLRADEIQMLLDRIERQPGVVICTAVDGGTNALLTSPPQVIDFSFGPDSGRRHEQLAHSRGVACQLVSLPYLRHDIDWPGDVPADLPVTVPAMEAGLP